MMRLGLAILVVALVLGLSPSPRASAHTGYWRVTGAGNGLRLRTGPGGHYHIIAVMPDGSLTKAFGHSGNWLKVRYLATGQVGWAFLSYFSQASTGGGGTTTTPSLQLCWDTSFHWTACAPLWIAQQIWAASQDWGVPYWALMGIASCESGFDPNAYNPASGVSGIYQFQPSTMAWIYPGGTVWSVHDSAYAAAKLLAWGYSSMFDCARRIGY